MKKLTFASLANVLSVAAIFGLAGEVSVANAQQVAPRTPTVPVPFHSYQRSVQRPLAGPVARAKHAFAALAQIGQSYDGIHFLGSNCGCLPPDTNAAVGNNFVVETVNIQIRIFDKTTGSVLLDEPLATFFGAFSGGDPYVVYDDIADRWYVSAFDSNDRGLFLAVSNDGNPLHGFKPTYHLTNVGGFPDYPKPCFNKDAIFISYNDFGSGAAAATVASIDKAAALSGTLIYYGSHPIYQFRAMPPAQMHGDKAGGVEWFVSTDGTDGGGNIQARRIKRKQQSLGCGCSSRPRSCSLARFSSPGSIPAIGIKRGLMQERSREVSPSVQSTL
jgi:hypothetical protein